MKIENFVWTKYCKIGSFPEDVPSNYMTVDK